MTEQEAQRLKDGMRALAHRLDAEGPVPELPGALSMALLTRRKARAWRSRMVYGAIAAALVVGILAGLGAFQLSNDRVAKEEIRSKMSAVPDTVPSSEVALNQSDTSVETAAPVKPEPVSDARVEAATEKPPAKTRPVPRRVDDEPSVAAKRVKNLTAEHPSAPDQAEAEPNQAVAGSAIQPREVFTDFLPIPGADLVSPYDSGRMVRVRLPRSVLPTFGLPSMEDRGRPFVNADVVLGEDGAARAVRFVSTSGRF